jgi:hypothetical protein
MKYNTSYIKGNIFLGAIIACFLLIFNAVGCFGQPHINIPVSEAVSFNKKVSDLLPGATFQNKQETETVHLYDYVINDKKLKVVYYIKNGDVNKIAVKGSKEDVQQVFKSFNPDEGKQFVLTASERIYIEKQTDATWALFISKR